MLIVVSMIALISTVPVVVMATAIGQVSVTTENLNWNASYEAAEAGLNDYIEHLDQNPAYDLWSSGNPNFKCTYSPTTALGYEFVAASWQWVDLKDAGFCGWAEVGNLSEWYEYSLPSTSHGSLALTVSGKAGSGPTAVVRTFTYNVVPTSSFLDNIYWTNYEMMDPTLSSGCASDLGIPSSTPTNQYVDYASEYMSQGPAPLWSGTGNLVSGSNQVTVPTVTGLAVGDTIADSGTAIASATSVVAITGNTLTLSSNATASATADTLYTTLTALPTAQVWTGTGTVTSGSNQVTGVSSTSGLTVGDVLTDSAADIPGGGTIVTAHGGNTLTLSQKATGTSGSDHLATTWSAYSQSPWPIDGNCWIWFAYGDKVNGPTFSNDTLRVGLTVSGQSTPPTFYGQVFSAAKGRQDAFTAAPEPCDYQYSGTTDQCQAGPATGLPPQFLGDEPQPTTAADSLAAQLIGCYISGGTLASPTPTWVDVSFTQSGSTTTLKWWKDPSATNSPNVDNATANGGNPNGVSGGKCGTSGATSGSKSTITVSNLQASLIYVNGNVTIVNPGSSSQCGSVSTTDDCDAGYLTIIAGDDTGVGPAEWGGAAPNAGDIYLADSIAYPNTDVTTTTTHCDAGWGQGGGMASGNCPRTDPSDTLGLVAQYFVQYPQAPGSSCPSPPFTVEGAMLALTDSVYANNWGSGTQCPLDVFGAIGQDFRGPVGTSGPSGYQKEYYYDTSLETTWPPYYLASTSSGWEPFGYAEGKAGSPARALASVAYASGCGTQC